MGDADTLFKTGNYGIYTTPNAEYLLVIRVGKGLKKGGMRTLRLFEYYDDLESVEEADLTRPEIIAIILYTGPMFQVSSATHGNTRQHTATHGPAATHSNTQ